MAALIFLRITEDWDNVNLDEITFPENLEIIRVLIKMWDDRFPIRYFRYRSLIKDIALRQWPLPYITELQGIGDDDWFIPSDDDDWFHHDLPEFLEKQDEEYVYWDSVVNVTSGRYATHKWFSYHDMIGSNNYAVKGSLLNRANKYQRGHLIHNHSRGIKFAIKLGAKIGEHKDKIMSCYNRHPGSLSVLFELFELSGMIKAATPAGEPQKNIPKWLEPSYSELVGVVEGLKKQIPLL